MPTFLTANDSLTYLSACGIMLISCVIGSWAVVRHRYLAFLVTLAALPIFLLALIFNRGSFASGLSSSHEIFIILKPLSVFVPIVLYAYVNLKTSASNAVPNLVKNFFSIVLFLNIAETTLFATGSSGIHGAIYAATALVLAVFSLRLPWTFQDGILGFSDRPFAIAFLTTLSYLYLFLFPPGTGWLAWMILLIPYLPISRIGHPWFAYRAYSLWVFFNFGFTLGLMQFYRELPLSINSMITTLRGSVLNELVLAAAILSTSFLFYSRVCSYFQKKYQNSSTVWPMDRE